MNSVDQLEVAEMKRCPLAVIILTLNEEASLPSALDSVIHWAEQVFVVDSFSTDRTVKIAESYGVQVYQNPFKNHTDQRNWALNNLPIMTEWIFFLDADEYLSKEIKQEIADVLESTPVDVNGFFTKMRYEFLGRWLKHGGIYSSLIRMLRKGKASYMNTDGCREKLVVEGKVSSLKSYIIHDDKKTVLSWVVEQCDRILLDAKERSISEHKEKKAILPCVSGLATMEGGKSQWLRNVVLLKLPGSIRPFAQFFYRYVLRLGFLDGWPGFIYHFLFQFWYPLMVEAFYIELRRRKEATKNWE